MTTTLPDHDVAWSMTVSVEVARSVTATADYPEHAPQATAGTEAFYEALTSEPIEHPTDPEALTGLKRG